MFHVIEVLIVTKNLKNILTQVFFIVICCSSLDEIRYFNEGSF